MALGYFSKIFGVCIMCSCLRDPKSSNFDTIVASSLPHCNEVRYNLQTQRLARPVGDTIAR